MFGFLDTSIEAIIQITSTMTKWSLAAILALQFFSQEAYSHSDSSVRTGILTRQEDVGAEYDYVVVGGGTAGLVVADRLSEDTNCTLYI